MNQTKESTVGKLYLTGAFVLAGTSVVAARFVTGKLGVFTIAAASMAIALVLLIPICWRKLFATLRSITFPQLFAVMLQAFFGMFLFRFLLLNGVARTSALEAGILTGVSPAITAFLAWALLRETVDLRTLGGIVATIIGGLLVQGLMRSGVSISSGHLVGNLLVVCAAVSESIFSIACRSSVLKKAAEGRPLDPLVQATLVTLIALLFCLIPAAFEQPLIRMAQIGFVEWSALLWYGFFITALSYLCWFAGIKRCGAFTAAAFSGLMPLTSMVLSTLLLHENTDVFQWLGGACVILGMLMIGRQKAKYAIENRQSGA